MELKKNSVFLMQGDSITDAGRDYNNAKSLGNGYALYFSALMQAKFPEKNIDFINKGISGNRAADLKGRWEKDCIDLNPDYVSILIGINDTWRKFDSNSETTSKEFEDSYRYILEETQSKTSAGILILEPFLLYDPADREGWRSDLDEKIFVSRKLAKEYGTGYIALDGRFAEASMKNSYKYWLDDGVHPANAGHMLIAQAMFEYFSD